MDNNSENKEKNSSSSIHAENAKRLAIKSKDLSKSFIHTANLEENIYPVTDELLNSCRKEFLKDPQLCMSSDMVRRFGLKETALLTNYKMKQQFHFSHTVNVVGNTPNQKQTGRCWLFAGLNAVRSDFIKKYNLNPDFEFSQTYLFFFHKLELANFFMDQVIEKSLIPLKSHEILELLTEAITPDGGYWVEFANLYNKYGIVPKDVMPDKKSGENSRSMNNDLKQYLKKVAVEIRKLSKDGITKEELYNKKDEYLRNVFNILSVNLGTPPKTFDWEFEDKNGNVETIENCTPQDFAKHYVDYNTEDKIRIDFNPLEEYPEYTLYHNIYDGGVSDGWPYASIKVPFEVVKKAVMDSIKDNQPVPFAQDVLAESNKLDGIMDIGLYDKKRLYKTDIDFDVKDRMRTYDITMCHLMMITGFHDPNHTGNPTKWKVQNSWGEDRGNNGNFIMSNEWFEKYACTCVIDKKYLPQEVLEHAFDKSPKKLNKYDFGL